MQTPAYRIQIKVLVENSGKDPCSQNSLQGAVEWLKEYLWMLGLGFVLIHVAPGKGKIL